ncbi:pentapeptide repeat-containing protein [Streptomyces spinoverrucosus]|nr:pentapeptide repeat-containing protein [Streptomyces spinoverrucosus]
MDKNAGTPCPNLQEDFRCGIHTRLRDNGFSGCTVFDCFGAGQKVSQLTFAGRDWRGAPDTARQMFDVFGVMRGLHELLWYLTDALAQRAARSMRDQLAKARDEIRRLTEVRPEELAALDVPALRGEVNELLLRAGELVRAQVRGRRADHRGADLMGAKLRGADLRGANLRGAYLIGADLQNADLRWAELIGADFRGADLSGADLTGSVFLTQPQVNAARGDAATKLPAGLERPSHWHPGSSSPKRSKGNAKGKRGAVPRREPTSRRSRGGAF